MRAAAKILAIAGCLAILFGFLALDFIPERILASLPADQRARTDRSILEMEWITRGFYSLGAGGVLLVAALLVGVIGGRRGSSQLQSK
jgi:hypothetical protein